MNLLEQNENGTVVLSIAGRLDNEASDLFRDRALQHVRGGVRFIVVDFTETTYIASMGIRALFIPTRELLEQQGRIALAGLNRDLRALLNTAGLLDLYPVYDTPAAALADPSWLKPE